MQHVPPPTNGRTPTIRFTINRPIRQLLADARLLGLRQPTQRLLIPGPRTHRTRPALPIAHLLRRRHRGSFLVLRAGIDTIGTDTVRLREGFTAYNPALNETGNE